MNYRNGGTYMTDAGDFNQGKRIAKINVQRIFEELGPGQIKQDLLVCLKSFDFFFTSKEQDYFEWEKLVVFFILYSNASKEQKSLQLFDLISEDVPGAIGQ